MMIAGVIAWRISRDDVVDHRVTLVFWGHPTLGDEVNSSMMTGPFARWIRRPWRALRWLSDVYDDLGGFGQVSGFEQGLQGGAMDPFVSNMVAMKTDGTFCMDRIAWWRPDIDFVVAPPPMPADDRAGRLRLLPVPALLYPRHDDERDERMSRESGSVMRTDVAALQLPIAIHHRQGLATKVLLQTLSQRERPKYADSRWKRADLPQIRPPSPASPTPSRRTLFFVLRACRRRR